MGPRTKQCTVLTFGDFDALRRSTAQVRPNGPLGVARELQQSYRDHLSACRLTCSPPPGLSRPGAQDKSRFTSATRWRG